MSGLLDDSDKPMPPLRYRESLHDIMALTNGMESMGFELNLPNEPSRNVEDRRYRPMDPSDASLLDTQWRMAFDNFIKNNRGAPVTNADISALLLNPGSGQQQMGPIVNSEPFAELMKTILMQDMARANFRR